MADLSFEMAAEIDYDGFICLVCPASYDGFVGADWSVEQIQSKFVDQMNTGSLFVAYPGPDLAGQSLRISGVASEAPCLRETHGLLQVGEDGLWLTDYSELTMAAQFSDSRPVGDYHVRLPVPAGFFRITVRQFAQSWEDELEPAAELVITAPFENEPAMLHQAVPWFD